jgi:hypothetical protein
MELVSQVAHCLGIFYTYHLQHHLWRGRTVWEDLGGGAEGQKN